MNLKYHTEEEREAAKREWARRAREKATAKRRAMGIQPKKVYASDEERKEHARQHKREVYAAKKAAEGKTVREKKVYATEEERAAAHRERQEAYRERKRAAEGRTKRVKLSEEELAEHRRAQKRTYYAAHKEEIKAYRDAWRAEHKQAKPEKPPQLNREERQRANAARSKAFNALSEEAAEAKCSRDSALKAARAAMPENGPWFRDWCEARGLDEFEAQKRSRLPWETFGILWKGGKTIPSLALLVGHNLGMNAEEVAHLGVILDRDSWEAWKMEDMSNKPPEFFALDWPQMVENFNPKATERLFARPKPKQPQPDPDRQAPHNVGREPQFYEKHCIYCGQPFTVTARFRRQVYCLGCKDQAYKARRREYIKEMRAKERGRVNER